MSGSSLRNSSNSSPWEQQPSLNQALTAAIQSPCLPVCCTRGRAAAGALQTKTRQNDSSISITDLGGSSCASAPQHQVRQQHLACTVVVHVLYGMAHTAHRTGNAHPRQRHPPTYTQNNRGQKHKQAKPHTHTLHASIPTAAEHSLDVRHSCRWTAMRYMPSWCSMALLAIQLGARRTLRRDGCIQGIQLTPHCLQTRSAPAHNHVSK